MLNKLEVATEFQSSVPIISNWNPCDKNSRVNILVGITVRLGFEQPQTT